MGHPFGFEKGLGLKVDVLKKWMCFFSGNKNFGLLFLSLFLSSEVWGDGLKEEAFRDFRAF